MVKKHHLVILKFFNYYKNVNILDFVRFIKIKDIPNRWIDEFFFHSEKSGRSITAAPDKIFTQTFFEGIDKGWNCGVVGVSIISGNRKCPKNREKVKKKW